MKSERIYDNDQLDALKAKEHSSGSVQCRGSASPDQGTLDFQALLVRNGLTDDERHYTTLFHIKAVLRVLRRKGVIR